MIATLHPATDRQPFRPARAGKTELRIAELIAGPELVVARKFQFRKEKFHFQFGGNPCR